MKKSLILKKIGCAVLSLGIAFSYMPLSSYALSQENQKHDGLKTRKVDDIRPGDKFTTGDYEISKNFDVVQTEPGKNGIEIIGKVRFIFTNDASLNVIGGDGKGATRGGAGVYLPESSCLVLEGKGTLNAKGGKAGEGQNGGNGENAETRDWTDIQCRAGASGAGGAGGGGAGAGIGTPGGEGGQPSSRIAPDWVFAIPGTRSDEKRGGNGGEGKSPERSGNLVIAGKFNLNAVGGLRSTTAAENGKGGDKKWAVIGIKDIGYYINCAAGGAGGGAGGNGFGGADVGSGGSGGGAGGSGGGGLADARVPFFIPIGDPVPGGIGGKGLGSNWKNSQGSKGGESFLPAMKVHSGAGGDGGLAEPTRAGGKVYCAQEYGKKLERKTEKTDYDGKENLRVRVIKESDCAIKVKDAPKDDIYEYTGKPIEPELDVIDKRTYAVIPSEAYRVSYLHNIERGKATIVVEGVEHSKKDIPIIVSDLDWEILGDLESYFTIE